MKCHCQFWVFVFVMFNKGEVMLNTEIDIQKPKEFFNVYSNFNSMHKLRADRLK